MSRPGWLDGLADGLAAFVRVQLAEHDSGVYVDPRAGRITVTEYHRPVARHPPARGSTPS